MPANIYMSLFGSDTASGLTPSTPVRSFTKAVSLLANKPGTQQTVWIAGGPSRAQAYQYGTLNGQPEYWRNNSKSGTATGWVVFRNMPGTYVRLKPLIQSVNTGYQDAVGTTNVGFNAFIWEVDNDETGNPDAHHFELDGGCTGLLSNGVTYNGSNYTPTAGVFMLGVSGVKMLDNNLTIDADGNVVTSVKGAYWSGGWIHHTKKALAVISNIEGPTCIRGILGTNGAMENVHMWSGDYGSGGTAPGVWPHTVMINSTVHFKSPDQKSLPGPAVIEDCVTQDTWGETIGPYAVNGCVIRRNRVLNACLGSLYNDIGEGFAMYHNQVYQTPDATYTRRGWGANASSETAQKWLRYGIIHNNVIHGPGVVLGWVKQGTNDYVRDILCAHNTVINTSSGQQALSSWSAAVDPSVRVQNNVFATTLTSAIAAFGTNTKYGTHKGNRWSKAPPNAGFLSGDNNEVLSLSAMRLAQSTPVTKAGMGPAWFVPASDSPLLGAGENLPTPPCWVDDSQTLFGRPFPSVVIGTPPAGSAWSDINGSAVPTLAPTIGAIQRAAGAVIPPLGGLQFSTNADLSSSGTLAAASLTQGRTYYLSLPSQSGITKVEWWVDTVSITNPPELPARSDLVAPWEFTYTPAAAGAHTVTVRVTRTGLPPTYQTATFTVATQPVLTAAVSLSEAETDLDLGGMVGVVSLVDLRSDTESLSLAAIPGRAGSAVFADPAEIISITWETHIAVGPVYVFADISSDAESLSAEGRFLSTSYVDLTLDEPESIETDLEVGPSALDDPWYFPDDSGVTVAVNFAVNVRNAACTLYSNYDFLALGGVSLDTEQYPIPIGIAEDGIFLLDGDDDDGTPIRAIAVSGESDFESDRLKSAPIIQGDVSGTVRICATCDGARYVSDFMQQGRARFGRGIRGLRWAFGFSNGVAGEDFEVRFLEPQIETYRKQAR